MTKLKLVAISAIPVVVILVVLAVQHQILVKERNDNQALRQQIEEMAKLEAENDRLSNSIARANSETPPPTSPPPELLRLRGEVGVLRRQLEWAQQPQLHEAQQLMNVTPSRGPSRLLRAVAAADSVEGDLRSQGKHWVVTTGEIKVGALAQDRLYGRKDQPEGRGALGRVVSIGTGDNDQPVATVDFGRGYSVSINLSELAPVSEVGAADSTEGLLLAQGKSWVSASGEITVGAFVADILDGRRDQPEGRGAIGKIVSISTGDIGQPVAVVDFGRGYSPGIYLSELAPVSVAPR
jgi:hypothetical protein